MVKTVIEVEARTGGLDRMLAKLRDVQEAAKEVTRFPARYEEAQKKTAAAQSSVRMPSIHNLVQSWVQKVGKNRPEIAGILGYGYAKAEGAFNQVVSQYLQSSVMEAQALSSGNLSGTLGGLLQARTQRQAAIIHGGASVGGSLVGAVLGGVIGGPVGATLGAGIGGAIGTFGGQIGTAGLLKLTTMQSATLSHLERLMGRAERMQRLQFAAVRYGAGRIVGLEEAKQFSGLGYTPTEAQQAQVSIQAASGMQQRSVDLRTALLLARAFPSLRPEVMGGFLRQFGAGMGGVYAGGTTRVLTDAVRTGVSLGIGVGRLPEYLQEIAGYTGRLASMGIHVDVGDLLRVQRRLGAAGEPFAGTRGLYVSGRLRDVWLQSANMLNPVPSGAVQGLIVQAALQRAGGDWWKARKWLTEAKPSERLEVTKATLLRYLGPEYARFALAGMGLGPRQAETLVKEIPAAPARASQQTWLAGVRSSVQNLMQGMTSWMSRTQSETAKDLWAATHDFRQAGQDLVKITRRLLNLVSQHEAGAMGKAEERLQELAPQPSRLPAHTQAVRYSTDQATLDVFDVD